MPTKTLVFQESSMMCYTCEAVVGAQFKEVTGIQNIRIHRNRIYVTVDDSILNIKKTCVDKLKEMGYELASTEDIEQRKTKLLFIRACISLVFGFILFGFSVADYPLSMNAMYSITVLSFLVLCITSGEMVYFAMRQLRKSKKISIDVLFSFSMVLAFLSAFIGVAFPGLGLTMALFMNYSAALMIAGFRALAKYIEKKSVAYAGPDLNFQERIPKQITVATADQEITMPVGDIPINSTIIVAAGQCVGLDAAVHESSFLEQGDSPEIDDFNVTGKESSRPVQTGQMLLAGTRVTKGKLYLKTLRTEQDSFLYALDKDRPPPYAANGETVTTKILSHYVPAIFCFAVIAFLGVGYYWSWLMGFNIFLAILVAACSCMLPIISASAIDIANQHSDKAIEILKPDTLLLSPAKKIVLDLNGTLTNGKPEVKDFIFTIKDAAQRRYILNAVTQIEATSKHPIAKLICAYLATKPECKSLGEYIAVTPKEVKEAPTIFPNGIAATISGQRFTIGTHARMRQQDIDTSEVDGRLMDVTDTQEIIYFAVDQQAVGCFVTEDELRPHMREFVARLQAEYKEGVYLCSGASPRIVKGFGDALNIPPENRYSTESDLLDAKTDASQQTFRPKEKFMLGLKADALGDGTNDTYLFKHAIRAFTAKSEHTPPEALQNNHAVIDANKLPALLSLLNLAKKTAPHVRRFTYLCLAYSCLSLCLVTGLPLFTHYTISPGFAAGLMMGQALWVFLSVVWFKRQFSDTKTAPGSVTPMPITPADFQSPTITNRPTISTSPVPALTSGLTR